MTELHHAWTCAPSIAEVRQSVSPEGAAAWPRETRQGCCRQLSICLASLMLQMQPPFKVPSVRKLAMVKQPAAVFGTSGTHSAWP